MRKRDAELVLVRDKTGDRMDQKVLNRFGHVGRACGERLTKIIRDTGRPCTRWLDRVEEAYNARSVELSDVKVMCMDREFR